jgi:hypothetical protein
MSQSATTAAKRRRAGNVVSTPLFRSNTNPSTLDSVQRRVNRSTENLQNETIRQLNSTNLSNTPQQNEATATDFKKPMSLQQVITVFDKRLLTLEKAIIENKVPMEASQQNVSINNELNVEQTQQLIDKLREDLKITLTEQSKEFDYRTTMLANEITNLKEIVMKLQSYTLEVNKTLYEEREQFYQESENSIHIEADEKLNEEDLEVIDNNENILMELVENSQTVEAENVEEAAVEAENVEEAAMETENVEEAAVEAENVEEAAMEAENVEEVAMEAENIEEEAVETETVEDAAMETENVEEPTQGKKSRRKKKEKKSLSVDL